MTKEQMSNDKLEACHKSSLSFVILKFVIPPLDGPCLYPHPKP
jgi:hypothetical protein